MKQVLSQKIVAAIGDSRWDIVAKGSLLVAGKFLTSGTNKLWFTLSAGIALGLALAAMGRVYPFSGPVSILAIMLWFVGAYLGQLMLFAFSFVGHWVLRRLTSRIKQPPAGWRLKLATLYAATEAELLEYQPRKKKEKPGYVEFEPDDDLASALFMDEHYSIDDSR